MGLESHEVAEMSDSMALASCDQDRLSRIETMWTMIYHAHTDGAPAQGQAQHELLARYGSAILRYLRGAFRDELAAEETYQEFAIRFLRGDYRTAHPDKGRFRGFLKVVLSRLVADHYRKQSRRREAPLESFCQLSDDSEQRRRDVDFLETWRDEMLTQAWRRLADEERRASKPWMTILKLRVENPELRSVELASQLAAIIEEDVTPTRLRVLLHRSRERFANYLIDAVAESIRDDTIAEVEQELAELQLLQYCQSVLEQRKAAA
jgi:RNA polymerase sigma-70 factor (ECF subfamily)